jgi:hypothetical protein
VAQGAGYEFKPQYHKKKKKTGKEDISTDSGSVYPVAKLGTRSVLNSRFFGGVVWNICMDIMRHLGEENQV